MSRASDRIRREFIEFFEARGHTAVPSSPLLPADDPTLLFANAGMNQFKDVFLGAGTRPYTRAVDTQKCIRAGGKHNDLEDVGHDTVHHTFFEMLGNWSFGDYFKAEAIQWAWELLTGVWGLPADRLWATVFAGDEAAGLAADGEAAGLWPKVTDLPAARVLRAGIKDNFWEMGETGPCGPCTEIHIDLGDGACGGAGHRGRACGVNVPGCGRFVELWNLVFIQFNRAEDGSLSELPDRHVDTGMGFERICAVLQGVTDNYATDVFAPLMAWLGERTGLRYGARTAADDADVARERPGAVAPSEATDVAFRVIADHARACAFAIADGVRPSNEGRGYVIRRILRRAARFGRTLGLHEPFLHGLVPVLADQMGEVFPELADRQELIVETIRGEEEAFNKTLDRGLELFERVAAKAQGVVSGDVAFELYATYGFPIDLTQLMAVERGLKVDMAGYEEEMRRHREVSAAGGGFQAAAVTGLPETDDSAKYAPAPLQAKVLGWVVGEAYVSGGRLEEGAEAAVVLDRTNFYAEAGGQVGDAGRLLGPHGTFAVRRARPAGHCVLHEGVVETGRIACGQSVTAEVSPRRDDVRRNHTATHLLNWALREVLGEGVEQAGSIVDDERLRFDFTCEKALTDEQVAEVERLVNERVLADEPVVAQVMPLAEARRVPGVRAVFGESYPDPVRVIRIGGGSAGARESAEFCGGTHLDRTAQAGLFKIVSEEAVARGVRRIAAVTGRAAVAHVQRLDAAVRAASAALRVPPEQVPERIAALQKEVKKLRKRPGAPAGGGFRPEAVAETDHGKVLVGQAETTDAAALRTLCDVQRQKGAAALLVGGAEGRKVALVAMVSEALVGEGKVRADEWVRAAAEAVGGSGGGKPTLAQAGGKRPGKLPEALAAGRDWIVERLAAGG